MSAEPPPPRPPTRSEVEAGRAEVLLAGSWNKADVYLARTPAGTIVVKDFAAKSLPARMIGRLQIARECRAYEALAGVEGIAQWLGRIDAHALALERLEGVPIRQLPRRERRDDLLVQLRATLDAIHERGVIHNDLRGQDNTLVTPAGKVVLIDFAGAFRFRRGSLLWRLLFDKLRQVDEAAFLKWKRTLRPASLTPEEERFLRRFTRLRRLWVFNPKGALKQS